MAPVVLPKLPPPHIPETTLLKEVLGWCRHLSTAFPLIRFVCLCEGMHANYRHSLGWLRS